MTDSPERLAERLASEGQKTIDFFSNLPDPLWFMTIYEEGTLWQVRQILAHLVSAEAANRQLIQAIMVGSPGAPLDFNIDIFNEKEVKSLASQPNQELIDQFKRLRQETIEFVLSLRTDDLQKQGCHPFFGVAALEDIIKLIYRHGQIHVRDIRKLTG